MEQSLGEVKPRSTGKAQKSYPLDWGRQTIFARGILHPEHLLLSQP